MNEKPVVSDAGPLLALAKLEALELLTKLYGSVQTSPAVFEEAVTHGLAQSAPDAPLLKDYFDHAVLVVQTVQSPAPLQESIRIQAGERESIHLAIELRATEFLVDDSRARKVAEQNFTAMKLKTITRGTLGIIYLSYQKGFLAKDRAIQLLESIKTRRDIWISAKLCDQILHLIRA